MESLKNIKNNLSEKNYKKLESFLINETDLTKNQKEKLSKILEDIISEKK